MTQRIYHTDSYAVEFTAKVVQASQLGNQQSVILDRSAFYPESGGQPADFGSIAGIAVSDVVEHEGEVCHLMPPDSLAVGATVKGSIDWDLRFDHMQQHTGQHILSQAFLQRLQAETLSFHMGDLASTIDLSIEEVDGEGLEAVEDLANQIIFEDRPISIHMLDSTQQGQLPVRKASDRSGTVRIIEVDQFDFSPCGGTHCRSAGEVGQIKIRRWERVKRKVRVEFLCGKRALADYRWKNTVLLSLAASLSVSDREVPAAIEKHLENEKALLRELEKSTSQLLELRAQALVHEAPTLKGVRFVSGAVSDCSLKELNKMASMMLLEREKTLVVLGSGEDKPVLLVARTPDLNDYDLREWVKELAPLIDGRGGGGPDRVQAGGSRPEGLEHVFRRAQELL